MNTKAQLTGEAIVKMDPGAGIYGDFPVSIELFNQSDNSFELSLGLSYKNWPFEASQPLLFNKDVTPIEDRKNTLGYSAKLAYKFYPVAKFFLAPEFGHIRYNYKFPLVNLYSWNNSYVNEKIIYNELRLNIGYQLNLYKNKLSLDFSYAAAFKRREINFFEEQSAYVGTNYQYSFGTTKTAHYVLGAYWNLKLGWAFNYIKK